MYKKLLILALVLCFASYAAAASVLLVVAAGIWLLVRPTSNSDLFAEYYAPYQISLMTRGQDREELWKNAEDYENKVYVLPKHLDEKVAALHLEKVGAKLTSLSKEQADYIGVEVKGPFKKDDYRY